MAARIGTGLAVSLVMALAGCGGGDDGPTEDSLDAWLAGGNDGEEPGCPLLTADDLAAVDGAETEWVGNDDDNLICALDLDAGRVGLAIVAPDTILQGFDPATDIAWTVDADEAVVVVDDTLAGDVRFVVVADAPSTDAVAQEIGDAALANLASDPDDVDSVGA